MQANKLATLKQQ